ncbi:23S rRNA (pseudouridine(1915)-N(3))-methyltransferase RlmH [Arhodomonas aquaeolei]|uniref:23S rRNA (pseudouridine(1915)-N(3))-methyltransferase RlmH n=1 Tax=Arhodomonas TaxID=2368 RepID=UPI00036BE2FD|nr:MULTISPECIES: 23S rRNA (pseudouridine(1915)-N(3))-methyltransferase RlmH [Arhodomonas]MCS4505007.1 23S rRNA (pseudouridine(1915)-N(3))-methyltransferase RlmH [Arhodomonas aquaeolei]
MRLRIAAVGQRMPGWVATGVEEFTRRMPRELPLEIVEIPASRARRGGDTARATAEEGERLLAAAKGARIVALDEGGRSLTTAALATHLDEWRMDGDDVAFLIGGADGLARECRQRAGLVWSLSALTFPHMLVRVILAEQLYRAWTVLSNHPYHRD